MVAKKISLLLLCELKYTKSYLLIQNLSLKMIQVSYDCCLLGLSKFSLLDGISSGEELRNCIEKKLSDTNPNYKSLDFYLIHNGSLVKSADNVAEGTIHVVPRLVGGKGGFGSMLRAIGAQIEKTTNREACRDLSGRRLRDINEEKRLKKWIAEQKDREEEQSEKKKKKLEKLCSEPKHEFSDETYDKLRSEMPDKVHEAVEQGLKATVDVLPCSSKDVVAAKAKKRPRGNLWLDVEDDLDSLDGSESDTDEARAVSPKKIKA